MLGLCFVLQYFVFVLVLQSSGSGGGDWLLYLCCVLNVMSLSSFLDSSLWCHGSVGSM